MFTPASHAELIDAIVDARGSRTKLELRGGGSKVDIGAPREVPVVSMARFSGVVDYDPAELVLTCGAATTLVELQALTGKHEQMLAFEPFDHGPIFGAPVGNATIGGIISAGVAGSQRLSQGGARDHLLGFEAVSGRGERFRAGAKVVKNVTGYDLPKLLTSSWGRLAALTEVTIKVLPRPQTTRTAVLRGLSVRDAILLMSKAMGSQADVAAAAHMASSAGESSRTLLRVQGFGPSVDARMAKLGMSAEPDADRLWRDVRDVACLSSAPSLWRVVVPAASACDLIEKLEPLGARWLIDWAGGLVWIGVDECNEQVREAATGCRGHAMLVRAPAPLRAAISTFHPQEQSLALLADAVRSAFDPDGIFNTPRFAAPNI